MTPPANSSPQITARVAGFLYLLIIVIGVLTAALVDLRLVGEKVGSSLYI